MDWSKFFSMGGYAFFVWGSYIVFALAIGGEVFLLLRRKKRLANHAARLTGKNYK